MAAILIRLPEDLHRELRVRLAEMGVSAQAHFLLEAQRLVGWVEAEAEAEPEARPVLAISPPQPPIPPKKRTSASYPAGLLAALPDLPALWEKRLAGCSRRPTVTAQNAQLERLVPFVGSAEGVAAVRGLLVAAGEGGWMRLPVETLTRALRPPVNGRPFVEHRGKAPEPLDVEARLLELADQLPAGLPERDAWVQRALGLRGGLAEVEDGLTALDGELLAAAWAALDDEARREVEGRIALALSKWEARLTKAELERIRAQFWARELRQQLGLRVLSLFE